MSSTFLRPITSMHDALTLRTLRNDCRKTMTHDTSIISIARQKNWYQTIYLPLYARKQIVCFLFILLPESVSIGFGVVQLRGVTTWLTGGLHHRYRGQGHGINLFQQLVHRASTTEVWLDVFPTNTVAVHIYKKIGFVVTEESYNENKDTLLLMRYRKDRLNF